MSKGLGASLSVSIFFAQASDLRFCFSAFAASAFKDILCESNMHISPILAVLSRLRPPKGSSNPAFVPHDSTRHGVGAYCDGQCARGDTAQTRVVLSPGRSHGAQKGERAAYGARRKEASGIPAAILRQTIPEKTKAPWCGEEVP